MPDYGHELLFGTFLTPSADDPQRVVELARATEAAGLDLVSVQDHPYQTAFLDAWTLLAVIAASTTTVRVFPNVTNLPMRPPAVLARSVASLDRLTGGRVELGLGAGAFNTAVVANGGPERSPAASIDALEEAIAIIRAIWAADRSVRVNGEHYRVVGAKAGPAPAHDVGIWIGAYKPRMLRLTGRLADGWLPSLGYAGPDRLAGMNRIIDDAALDAGREPAAVRRLYNINGTFGSGDGSLHGSASEWAERLAELALTEGISGFVLASDSPSDIRRFGAEVASAVRSLVGAARGTTAADLAEPVWAEALRPAGPMPRSETTRPSGAGRDLIAVHDHLRQELASLYDMVDEVESGHLGVAAARSNLNEMTLRQNNWTLGAYCESYCRVVTMHHTIEDASVFPHLRRTDPRLAPVLDRLSEEHHIIHGAIDGVDRALVGLVEGGDVKDLRTAVDLLAETLRSHLTYEEDELVEPLTRYGFF
ncbi:MAG TPA: LLM class flavin-dependent oxidoreductase [Micromonosporaceae bacterium]|jgi:alkanesulfonate monooxygenase SsuD/methylene tetrahydromethanopterin reductase-like flavin-dependent oxidoreductase (luciferase family)